MSSLDIVSCISQAMEADGSASPEVKRQLRSFSLLTICRALKDYLCDVDKVQPAMQLLASTSVDRGDLSKTDVQLLLSFFSDKLSQLENQTAALSCLALLISSIRSHYKCSAEWFDVVAPSFVKQVRVQQLPLNCRKQCFCILTFLFTEATLPRCGSTMLGALLELLDGESDPELVLQTFDLYVVIATRATRDAFLPVRDDYFDSISSYFPVVFSQPPGCSVTKADLRTHLKRCLCLAVFSESCVPFMQGKLASPSIAVKEDVVDTLLTCFDTYSHAALAPFYPSLVVHMKSEVVKLSSFSDRASSPALTKCIYMCCEILGRVSKTCGAKSQAEALEVFGPVLEGFLSALSADTSVTSAYATMVFHVLTGSWSCCVFVAAYLFSMLAMSLSDTERPANVYILFSALVTGMLDALAAFPGDDHVRNLRDCIERSTPPVAEAVQQCTARWGLLSSAAGTSAVDDFTVVCGCEFVVSMLKLALPLQPWLAADVVRDGIDALVRSALFRSSVVSVKVCKLLRDYAAEDGGSVLCALTRLLEASDVPADAGLVVVCEIASFSTDALLRAYEGGFLSPHCAWMAAISPERKARALEKALDHFGDALRASEAARMTAMLTRSDVPPDYFQCACLVARSLGDAACAPLMSDDAAVSQLGVAALLASRKRLTGVGQRWVAEAGRLASLTTHDIPAWRRVGMEGVTGAVVHQLDGGIAAIAAALPPDAQLLVAVAALWGGLLTDGDGDSGSDATTARHAALVSSFAQTYVQDDLVASAAAAVNGSTGNSVVEAFTFLPFAAQHRASRPSLLHLLLETGAADCALHTSTVFCTAVRCLVESETDAQVQSCLTRLLEVLNAFTQCRGAQEGALARALLFSVDAKCGGCPALARSLLRSDATMSVLLAGVTDAALPMRQCSLQLLTSLARGASAMAGDCAPEEKTALTAVRACVLDVVKRALGDHKRKVRQAAAACSREWYKVR